MLDDFDKKHHSCHQNKSSTNQNHCLEVIQLQLWSLFCSITFHFYGFIWLNVDLFLHNFRDRVVCVYKQEWHSVLTNSSRYDSYTTFKSFLQPEKYLSFTMSRNLRSYFIRLRLGLLDTNIN